MESTTQVAVAAVGVGLFGLFMLWQGISGNVIKRANGKPIFPRWFYVVGGGVVLILPLAYLVLMLQIS